MHNIPIESLVHHKYIGRIRTLISDRRQVILGLLLISVSFSPSTTLLWLFGCTTAQIAPRPLHSWSFQMTYKSTHTHHLWFLWKSSEIVAEVATHTKQTQQTNIHALRGFELAIPTTERPQTYILDGAATGFGHFCNSIFKHGAIASFRSPSRCY